MNESRSCYNCDRVGNSRCNLPMYKPHEGTTVWYVGLDARGQGHFSCEDCKDGLFGAGPLVTAGEPREDER